MRVRTGLLLGVAGWLVGVAAAAAGEGRDYFLTIGGGGAPQNNQVSLERNVVYFRQALGDCGLSGAPHDVLFACGTDASVRDLQFVDPRRQPPRANLLLARLFGSDEALYHSYRAHDLPAVQGPATRAALTTWFQTTGARIADGDRLFVYFTGHGSGGQKAAPRNTTMDLWLDGGMPVREFAGLLDKLSPKVQVVLVMVQCHSGGFADVIFKDGVPGSELSRARRCGFFATWHDRVAAGCTPDTVEENYREYSTYFLAALSGRTRGGKRVPTVDYDGDGRTSLAEAHAYVQLTSDTVDIPVCTSDGLLRQFSRARPGNERPAPAAAPGGAGEWVAPSAPFARLCELASPDRRAVLEGLSKVLGLTGDDRAAAARGMAGALERQRKDVQQQKGVAMRDREPLRRGIRGAVLGRWPEMSNAWHSAAQAALAREPEAIVKAIESHGSFAKWDALVAKVDELDDKDTELERKWVKCQRFLYTAESVALEANLERAAPRLVQERYKAMRAAETSFLGSRR